ncbi:MAG: Ig-like domain-containing protein [Clostridiales bacterium]|nr:Ig-like domain-containing protein [Clostridiales bacterium]
MKKQQNEPNDLLHCKNCDGYYDPSLPNCPHCGEETANNTMEGDDGHLTVDQCGGGYGEPGSALSRASLLIIIVLLLIALVTAVWLCVQALSQGSADTGATSSQVEETDPADASAQGDVSDSAAASSAPAQQEPEEEDEDETVEAETLTLDFYDLTLSEGETYDLTATVSPAEWEGDFTWSSDDKSVATVKQNGLVTYVGEGQCTVTVSAGGLTAQCVVRCNAPAEEEEPEETQQTAEETTKTDETEEAETETETTGSIVVEYTDITLTHVGDGYTCNPTGGNGTYTWSSANTSIATVSSSGYIVGVSKGTTTVTCTSGSETLTIIVRVAPD